LKTPPTSAPQSSKTQPSSTRADAIHSIRRSERRERTTWWLLAVVAPLTALSVGAILAGSTDGDARSLEPFFEAAPRGFPLHSHWFFQDFLHLGGKYTVIAVSVAVALTALLGIRNPRRRAWSGRCAYLVTSLVLTVSIAGIWKDLAHQGQPINLKLFGGDLASVDEHSPSVSGLRLGSPAAHAATAFAWMSLYFVAASLGVRRRFLWLVPSLLLGLLFAGTQHLRGAHVPSHNLWSIAIAWAVAAGVAALFRRLGWLEWSESPAHETSDATLATRGPVPLVESWLVGFSGLLFGTGFFAIDLAMDELKNRVHDMHDTFERVEWLAMGPGFGIVAFLIFDRVRTMRERSAQRAVAEREERFQMLGRMAASVAHEVRNPLHTLRLILDEQRIDVKGFKEHPLQADLETSIERIDRAVELVYRLARPGADVEETTDLSRAVRDSIAAVDRSNAPREVFDVGHLPELAEVRASPSGLRIVVDNLLRNAVEAAGSDGRVGLDLARENRTWVLRVSNPGRLAPATRAPNGATDARKSEGLGLGVAISRQIAASSGGSIDLREREGNVECTLRWPALEKRET
jgi:membrane-associated PAP2 superfamily phosphatase